MNVKDVLSEKQKIVVIVHFKFASGDSHLYNGGHPPQNPACLLQITLDYSMLSPSGKLIRLGARGDEIIGWMKMEALEVVEILGVVSDDGKTVEPYIPPKTTELLA